jgi:hypothetical protein
MKYVPLAAVILLCVSCPGNEAQADIGEVVNYVKTSYNKIPKKLIAVDSCTYRLESRVDGYTVVFNMDTLTELGDGGYEIEFAVGEEHEKLVWRPHETEAGILLSLDDYYPSWDEYLYLFDEMPVTFFVVLDRLRGNFALRAAAAGHEIGFHTKSHPGLDKVSRQRFDEETAVPASLREAGIDLVSFAYPYGAYRDWMNDALRQTYRFTRGYTNEVNIYTAGMLKQGGFFQSKSIDYNKYNSDETFEKSIRNLFAALAFIGGGDDAYVLPLTTHAISPDDTGWAIRPRHIIWIRQTAREFGLHFYRYKDFAGQ